MSPERPNAVALAVGLPHAHDNGEIRPLIGGNLMIKRSVPLSLLVVLVIGLSQSTLHGASSSTDSASRPILSVASSARNVNVNILIQEAWDELPLGMNWADGSRHGQWRDRWN